MQEKKETLRFLSTRSSIILGIGCLLIFFSIFWGMQMIMRFRHHPAYQRNSQDPSLIQSWMTLQFVSSLYHIPPAVLLSSLNLTDSTIMQQSIQKIAKNNNKDTAEFLKQVQLSVRELQLVHQKRRPEPEISK